jgi:CBS domain-containing protein
MKKNFYCLKNSLYLQNKIINFFLTNLYHNMNTVRHILKRKGHQVYHVAPTTHVIDALHLMEEKNIGCVMVKDADKYVGILTERDYARKVITKGRRSITTNVGDIMTTHLPLVDETDTIDTCMALMAQHHQRYLPVRDENGSIGIISITDLITEKLIEQKTTIQHLESYIRNSY